VKRDFAIAPPGKSARVSLVALIAVLPALTIVLVLALGTSGRMPAAGLWITTAAGAGMILLAGLLWFGLHRMQVRLEDGVLRVRASGYRRRVALSDLDLAAARVLALDASSEFAPRIKLNGIGLPGVAVGHFRGRPLKRRLFCALTERRRVLVLPERGCERALVLSVEKPQELLDALGRSAAGLGPRARVPVP